MRKKKEYKDSFLNNCIIIPKEDQKGPMFNQERGGKIIACRLDGYVIMPIEKCKDKNIRNLAKDFKYSSRDKSCCEKELQ